VLGQSGGGGRLPVRGAAQSRQDLGGTPRSRAGSPRQSRTAAWCAAFFLGSPPRVRRARGLAALSAAEPALRLPAGVRPAPGCRSAPLSGYRSSGIAGPVARRRSRGKRWAAARSATGSVGVSDRVRLPRLRPPFEAGPGWRTHPTAGIYPSIATTDTSSKWWRGSLVAARVQGRPDAYARGRFNEDG
jgi:hypothetical protein